MKRLTENANELCDLPHISSTLAGVRKARKPTLMRLKSYQIDGRLLRTGAASFSASGLKRQDKDLIVIKDAQAAAKFQHTFEAQFASGKSLSLAESN
jgi:hypothetical protein